jgi:hypothetical protein
MAVPYQRPPVPSEAERLEADVSAIEGDLELSAAKFLAALRLQLAYVRLRLEVSP